MVTILDYLELYKISDIKNSQKIKHLRNQIYKNKDSIIVLYDLFKDDIEYQVADDERKIKMLKKVIEETIFNNKNKGKTYCIPTYNYFMECIELLFYTVKDTYTVKVSFFEDGILGNIENKSHEVYNFSKKRAVDYYLNNSKVDIEKVKQIIGVDRLCTL